jgi:hypothetical protein
VNDVVNAGVRASGFGNDPWLLPSQTSATWLLARHPWFSTYRCSSDTSEQIWDAVMLGLTRHTNYLYCRGLEPTSLAFFRVGWKFLLAPANRTLIIPPVEWLRAGTRSSI